MQNDSPYTTEKTLYLEEIQATLTQLRHTRSGATVLHIDNDDPENLFCLSFRTFPSSSNGAPHILEHTVLCGSENYPVRDPFFSMTRRSLATFMNAMTGDDLTFYPAATQSTKDFYNLLEVYLDAVFHPNLRRLSFLQEGHRLEFAEPEDSSSPLEYKGIVYNEMKGALSQPDQRLYHALMAALLPDTPYHYNSGGNPPDILTLSYEELLDFHRTYYHPSRCTFFFYGNMPLANHLSYLNERLLSKVDSILPLPTPLAQPRFQQPIALEGRYPIGKEEEVQDKGMMSIAWLTCRTTDPLDVLTLEVVDQLLMATDAAPLKRALLRSGLCRQAGSYVDSDMPDVPWVLNLRGLSPENGAELEKLILETMHEVEKLPLDHEAVEAAIHQLEIDRCEISNHSGPYGLSLFLRTVPLLQHGGEPEDGLRIHSLFARLRERCTNEKEVKEFYRHHLLDNTHRVRLVMRPDSTLSEEEYQEEQEALQKRAKQLSDQEKSEIVEQAKRLALEQERDDPVDTLPKLELEDIPREVKRYALQHSQSEQAHCYHHTCFTNRIGYLSTYFNLGNVPEGELSLMRLFTTLLPQVGCGGRSYEEVLRDTQLHTGGISASLALFPQATNCRRFHPMIALSGCALHSKIEKLIPLMCDMIQSADFSDQERVKELIWKLHTALEHGLSRNALPYAIQLASSGLSVASRVANAWWGIEYLQTIREITRSLEGNTERWIQKLQEYQNRLILGPEGDIVVSGSEELAQKLHTADYYGLSHLDRAEGTPLTGVSELPEVSSQALVISSPVAFTCKMVPTVSYTHPNAPALNVAARLFHDKVLHLRIREQGGAYGSGASHSPMLGHFHFFAYRDPNLASTLDAFDEAIEMAVTGNFSSRDLEEAKLQMIQKIDRPISPGDRAQVAYSWLREGRSDEMRAAYREAILATTQEELQEAVQRHLKEPWESAITVTAANRDFLQRENQEMARQGRGALPLIPV